MRRREQRQRIVGIDWLELYANESTKHDYSPDAFRRRGYDVREREYGTKTMAQMFTLLDGRGYPFIEIRREPRGVNDSFKQTVYQPGDCYVKLCNAYCYSIDPVGLLIDFMQREKYTIKKIYRIDVFTDFEIFDTGDKPANVVRRIVNHTYSKVNQAERSTHGVDTWTECLDNWISWGKKGSMVGTKIYNKTKEMIDSALKKPWIAELWKRYGYIDDVTTLRRNNELVQMWRIEFSIKGNAKGWIWIDKDDAEDGCRHMLTHNLQLYSTRQGIINAIANLIPYYFHFKIYEEGKRKSLCQDKQLFIFDDNEYEGGYRLTNISDFGRIRPQDISQEVTALYHLKKAYTHLIGTHNEKIIVDMITELQEKANEKTHKMVSKPDDIF